MKKRSMQSGSVALSMALMLAGSPMYVKAASQVQSVTQQADEMTVGGVVLDPAGDPVIGATIIEKGTTNGAMSDLDGHFTLAVKPGATLVISYVGFTSQEVNASGKMKVTLEEDRLNLEEVVVVGFGTQKKINLTGSVASVSADKLGNRPITNLAQGLQGTMPGVAIKYSSGQPGLDDGGTSIRVRGTGTFNQAAPMIIVDGMESTMYDLDPNDIESVSVLKDAASASIYGSKAANGVILVTTKHGKAGPGRLNYSATFGWQTRTREADYCSSAEYAQLINEEHIINGGTALYTEEEIQKFRDGSDPYNYANTDWLGMLFRTGFQQTHNANISGGSESLRYMASMGYTNQKGLIRNSSKEKYNGRINLDGNVGRKLEYNFGFVFSKEDLSAPNNPNRGNDEIFSLASSISPMVPYKKENGDYGYTGDGNPIAWLDANTKTTTLRSNLQTNASLKYYFLPELSLKGVLAYKQYNGETHEYKKAVRYDDSFVHGTIDKLNESYYRDDRTTFDLIAEYRKTFAEKHNLALMAGYHSELYRNYSLSGHREDSPSSDLSDLNAFNSKDQTTGSNRHQLAMLSYFGRVNYDFLGRYLFEANLRYDASSRFARGHRWGAFPSVSAGWRFSEENFFQPLKHIVDAAKLRASWGKLGNQDIGGFYPTVSTLSLGQVYPFGGAVAAGAYTTDAVNPNLKWEATTTWGVGLDFTLINKITVAMDYYNKTTNGILMNVNTPMTFALNNFYDNVGEVRNTGFEFSATYREHIGDVDITIGGNIAFNKNKIVSMGTEGGDQYINDGNGVTYGIMRTGEAMNSFFGYKSDGLFQTQEEIDAAYPNGTNIGYTPKPGDVRYIDTDGNGILDSDDRVVLGSWDPEVTFGFTLGAEYKGFDFTAAFQGATNVHGYISRQGIGWLSGDNSKPTTLWLDHWTPDNPNASAPRLTWGREGWSMPVTYSDYWMQDATYLRLKTLQIGYTLPKTLLSKWGISNCRIFYTGENVLTLTDFLDGYDPETPASNTGDTYPQTKVHSIGINLTF